MTSVHQYHLACLYSIRYPPSSLFSSTRAADTAASSPVSRKPISSFRIADILTPSSQHLCTTNDVIQGQVVRQDHVTSTRETTTTLSDNDDSNGVEYVEVDDVVTSQQVMTSGVNALGRLVQMTYNAVDDDVDKRRYQRQNHRHRPG